MHSEYPDRDLLSIEPIQESEQKGAFNFEKEVLQSLEVGEETLFRIVINQGMPPGDLEIDGIPVPLDISNVQKNECHIWGTEPIQDSIALEEGLFLQREVGTGFWAALMYAYLERIISSGNIECLANFYSW